MILMRWINRAVSLVKKTLERRLDRALPRTRGTKRTAGPELADDTWDVTDAECRRVGVAAPVLDMLPIDSRDVGGADVRRLRCVARWARSFAICRSITRPGVTGGSAAPASAPA